MIVLSENSTFTMELSIVKFSVCTLQWMLRKWVKTLSPIVSPRNKKTALSIPIPIGQSSDNGCGKVRISNWNILSRSILRW